MSPLALIVNNSVSAAYTLLAPLVAEYYWHLLKGIRSQYYCKQLPVNKLCGRLHTDIEKKGIMFHIRARWHGRFA